MRRIILVLALVALLVVAAVVPAVAETSSTGLGSIVPTLAKTVLPTSALPDSWVSSDEDISADEEAAENSNASLNSSDSDSDDSDVNSLNASDSDSDNSGSSSSGSSVSQSFESEDIESGEASPSVGISNTGDNANLCAAVQQSANTGNVANQQGVDQYNSTADDIEFEGSSITITPELAAECTQTIEQSSAAGT